MTLVNQVKSLQSLSLEAESAGELNVGSDIMGDVLETEDSGGGEVLPFLFFPFVFLFLLLLLFECYTIYIRFIHHNCSAAWILACIYIHGKTPMVRYRQSQHTPRACSCPVQSLPPSLIWALLSSQISFVCFWTKCQWNHIVCTLFCVCKVSLCNS